MLKLYTNTIVLLSLLISDPVRRLASSFHFCYRITVLGNFWGSCILYLTLGFLTFFSLCLVRLLFPVYEVFNVLGTFSVPCRLSRTSNILSLPISLVNTFFTFSKSFLRSLLGILDGVSLSPLVRRLVFIISYPFSYWQVVFSFFMINCL